MSSSSRIVIRVFPLSAGTTAPRLPFEKSYSLRIVSPRTASVRVVSRSVPRSSESFLPARWLASRTAPHVGYRHHAQLSPGHPQIPSLRRQTPHPAFAGWRGACPHPIRKSAISSICTTYAHINKERQGSHRRRGSLD